MTNIYYDFEFLERGPGSPLLPISLGMTRDDGAEYYAISDDLITLRLAELSPWLIANVLPSLPVHSVNGHSYWDDEHPEHEHVKYCGQIRDEAKEFILGVPHPQLWGWYCAYDHVLLAQLFGRMTDLPEGIPMYSNDLKQEARETPLPPMPGVQEHNALSDAREIRWRYHYYRRNFSVHGICPCGGASRKCEVS